MWILRLLTRGLLINPFITQVYCVTLTLSKNYDPAYTRPIPYPAYETEHIPVPPSYFHPAWHFYYHPASRQTYVRPSIKEQGWLRMEK